MDPARLAKYEKLCEHIRHLPDVTLAFIEEQHRAIFSAIIFIPHHEFARPCSELLRDLFLEKGFGVDTTTHQQVSGPEFVIRIQSLSPYPFDGLTFHGAYLPTVEGLMPHQIANLRKVAHAIEDYWTVMNEMRPNSMFIHPY